MSSSRRSFFRDLAAAVASARDVVEPPEPEPMVPELTDAEIERYARQLVLPEWGAAAQLALAEASVLVIGAGALGSPVAMYLAGAGVGRLGIVDDDTVEVSNLHRQLLHFTPDVGVPKAESAAAKLRFLNPDVVVEPYRTRVAADNAAAVIEGQDLVVDCSDAFATRYAVNAACCAAGVALVEAGVLGMSGLVMSVKPGRTACYRCAFPSEPADAPRCADAGVLGPAAGVLGSLQALEAMKLLTGVAPALTNGFLQVDLATLDFLRVHAARREDCPDCGEGLASRAWPDSGTSALAGELRRDVAAAHDRDPAARGVSSLEILVAWPGVQALLAHRLAHALDAARVPFAPRVLALVSRSITNIEIHPCATIGDGLFIDHGTGVVIGETAEVGDERDHVPGRHARRHGLRHRQAPSRPSRTTSRSGRAPSCWGRSRSGTAPRSARTRSSSTTCRRTRPWSASPAIRCGWRACGPRGPDADWAHLPDPVADAVKMLSARVAELERAAGRGRRARRRPPRSSRCATGAAPIPPEVDRPALREHRDRRQAARRGVPVAARGRPGAALDDRSRGLRAARARPAARGLADPPGAVGQRPAPALRAATSPRSTRRDRALLQFEGSGFKAANEYVVRAAGDGSAVTWVISGDTTSFKARLIAPMVQAKLQEKLDVDLGRLRALLEGEAAAA